jgi:hypothetical protein
VRTFWRTLYVLLVVGLVCLAVWWRPVIVHVSQWTGTSDEASRGYAYWSGFGSVFPWSLAILASIVGFYRIHLECHSDKCFWPGSNEYDVDGVKYKLCRRCHPKIDHTNRLRRHHFHEHHQAQQQPQEEQAT